MLKEEITEFPKTDGAYTVKGFYDAVEDDFHPRLRELMTVDSVGDNYPLERFVLLPNVVTRPPIFLAISEYIQRGNAHE